MTACEVQIADQAHPTQRMEQVLNTLDLRDPTWRRAADAVRREVAASPIRAGKILPVHDGKAHDLLDQILREHIAQSAFRQAAEEASRKQARLMDQVTRQLAMDASLSEGGWRLDPLQRVLFRRSLPEQTGKSVQQTRRNTYRRLFEVLPSALAGMDHAEWQAAAEGQVPAQLEAAVAGQVHFLGFVQDLARFIIATGKAGRSLALEILQDPVLARQAGGQVAVLGNPLWFLAFLHQAALGRQE